MNRGLNCPSRKSHQPVESMTSLNLSNVSGAYVTARYMSTKRVAFLIFDLTGTHLTGKVTLAHPAKMFHRGGQLRFTFNKVELPSSVATFTPQVESAQTQLTAAESPTGPLAVDGEGTAKTTETKARFLRPIIAGLVAAKSLDNDEGKQAASGGANANYSGRSLGGLSGFGLLGTAASFGPHYIGAALGFYGLAWSVYSTVISRGADVKFEKNSALSIRFAPPKTAATLHGSH